MGLGSDSSLGPTGEEWWGGGGAKHLIHTFTETNIGHRERRDVKVRLLTLHIDQCADVGAAHRVGHLAGHGVGEVGVVHGHFQTVPVRLGDGNSAFRPPASGKSSRYQTASKGT